MRIMWNAGLIVVMTLGLVACGGGGEDTVDDLAAVTDDESSVTPLPRNVPKMPPPAGEAAPPVDPLKYQTKHDPDAVYGYSDITMEGSYLKLNLEDLTDQQMNRVIHRLRTEFCTCGCPKDTIDQCLVNDPSCGTAPTLAKQIIREERLKS